MDRIKSKRTFVLRVPMLVQKSCQANDFPYGGKLQAIWYMSILLYLLKKHSPWLNRHLISRINSNLNKTKNSSLFFYLFFLIKFGTIVSILINQDAIWYDGINQFLSTKSRLALITVMYQILGQLQPEPKYNITRHSKVKISWLL